MAQWKNDKFLNANSLDTTLDRLYKNCISIDAPFISAFSLAHFLYLSAFFAILTFILTNQELLVANHVLIARGLLAISIGQQIMLYSWYYFETGFDVKQALPLHICRISTLLGIVYLLTGNAVVMNVLFYFGLYAYFSFFMPSRINKIYHVSGLSYFINHVITILLPYYAHFTTGWLPTMPGLCLSLVFFVVFYVLAYFVNQHVDGNYFYMKNRPLPVLSKVSDEIYHLVNFAFASGLFIFAYWAFNAVFA